MRSEKHGTQRKELSVGLLDEAKGSDASVRVIDLFVDRLGDLTKLGFSVAADHPGEKARPAYSHSALLKCYLYGHYYYGIRSLHNPAQSGQP